MQKQIKLSPGHQLELEVFGKYSDLPLEELRMYEYQSFYQCMKEAKKTALSEGWNRWSPGESVLINNLFERVKLEIKNRVLPYNVRVYPSVGTKFDYFHGVDGWFSVTLNRNSVYDHNGHGRVMICFDITTSRRKWGRRSPEDEILIFRRNDFTRDTDLAAKEIVDSAFYKLKAQSKNFLFKPQPATLW